MINKSEALSADTFHSTIRGECLKTIGKRGGVTIKIDRCRRNGKTQTWKTRPEDFRVPIKFGLYTYGAIENHNASQFHTEKNCPLNEN